MAVVYCLQAFDKLTGSLVLSSLDKACNISPGSHEHLPYGTLDAKMNTVRVVLNTFPSFCPIMVNFTSAVNLDLPVEASSYPKICTCRFVCLFVC